MGAKYQALKGMEDLLPGEIEKWQWLEEKARIFFESRGFKEIRTPILEPTELFVRSVGEASDIVYKQMFSFEDRGGRNISLRPEMTASVARAVIEHGLLKKAKSLRLYYMGPMFRAERPQAGRKRQFHQIGIEIINEAGWKADFEVVSLLHSFLIYTGVKNSKLWLNDLGRHDEMKEKTFRQFLKDYFTKEKSKLCKDCQYRLEKNVLRIFDCKVESCQPVIQKAPEIGPISVDFVTLKSELSKHNIISEVKRRLVRGLDYYNGLVFEVTAQGLGAQDAVAGGGRYDSLYGSLGGGSVPATGFSIGIERLLKALEESRPDFPKEIQSRRIYFASLVEDAKLAKVSQEKILLLREAGFPVETIPQETSLSAHLKKANQLGVRYVIICGEDELKRNKLSLKDLEKHAQKEIELSELLPSRMEDLF